MQSNVALSKQYFSCESQHHHGAFDMTDGKDFVFHTLGAAVEVEDYAEAMKHSNGGRYAASHWVYAPKLSASSFKLDLKCGNKSFFF